MSDEHTYTGNEFDPPVIGLVSTTVELRQLYPIMHAKNNM